MSKSKYQFVRQETTRHGKQVFYFVRRDGAPKIRMAAAPGEPGFEAEWHGLMAAAANGTLQQNDRTVAHPRHVNESPGSVGDLAVAYFKDHAFTAMMPRSRFDRRSYIEQALQTKMAQLGGEPFSRGLVLDTVGKDSQGRAVIVQGVTRKVIKALRSQLPAPKREGCNDGIWRDAHVKALRVMFNWAIDEEWQAYERAPLLKSNPCARIKPLVNEEHGTGHHSWTDDECARFTRHHRPGSMAYLAFMIMRHTAMRRSDAFRFGRNDIDENGVFRFTEFKNRDSQVRQIVKEHDRVVPAALMAAIRATPGAMDRDTFIVTDRGARGPYSRQTFGQRFNDWARDAGLVRCTAHGVRKHVMAKLAEAGATNSEMKAVGGWTNDKTLGRYTKQARQRRLANNAMARIDRPAARAAA